MNHYKTKKLHSKFLSWTKTASLLSGTLAVALTGCCTAQADPPTTIPDWVGRANVYEVFLYNKNKPQHKDARLLVFQSGFDPDEWGLLFQQTRENAYRGKGMTCQESRQLVKRKLDNKKEVPDLALSCHQHKGLLEETLTIASLDSDFCDELREREITENERTPDGGNPIATPEECKEKLGDPNAECVCFEIEHTQRCNRAGRGCAPPSSGTGTGGHGNN